MSARRLFAFLENVGAAVASKAIAVFVVAALVCSLPSVAGAHAYVVSETPQAQSTVATAPNVVTITFDEQIDLPDGPAVEVVNAAGKRVDKNDAAIDAGDVSTVDVHLAAISRGSYTVRWRVVSADTHVVHGSFTFGYGVVAQSPEASAVSVFDPSAPLASILRWFTFLGIVLAVGAFAFGFAFDHALNEAFERSVGRHIRYGSVTAILASTALFVVQSIASAGNVLLGTSDAGLLATLQSPFGIAWLVKAAALIVLALCSIVRFRYAVPLGMFAAAVALGTLSVAGHASGLPAYGNPRTTEIVDWLHVVSISVWLGGLAVLIGGLAGGHGKNDEREVRGWLARFSRLAVPAVVVMLASGLYDSLVHEPHPTLLFTTLWGVYLGIKIVMVIVLLALGALSLRAGLGGDLRSSSTILRVEATLAVVVLAVTAFLVGQSPPTCMFVPPGSHLPADIKMPPGMQMCVLQPSITRRATISHAS